MADLDELADRQPKDASEDVQQEWENDDDPLILWMISLTPRQRLDMAQGFADSLWKIRHANQT